MLTDQERFERDPVALQQELLAIEKEMLERQPVLEAKHKAYLEARAEYEVEHLRFKLLKERRSSLQSVLRSVSQF